MRKAPLAAAAAIVMFSAPALAQEQGHRSGGLGADPPTNANTSGQVQDDSPGQSDPRTSDRAHPRTGSGVNRSASAATGAGLVSRSFRVGQRVGASGNFYTDVRAIPSAAKTQIPGKYLTDAYRYIYQSDRVYVVSNTRNKVVSVINLNP